MPCGQTYLSSSFCQAEGGIRDLTVTGVQTCALPVHFHPLHFLLHPLLCSILELCKQLAKVLVERVAQHLLEGPVGSLTRRVLATTRGQTEKNPVGGSVARAAKPLGVNKGFQIIERVSVETLPVARQHPRHTTENVRCHVSHLHPLQNEESAVWRG